MKNDPIIMERTFDAPVERVWKALTDNSQMKRWYFDLAEFKPEAGFEFRFSAGPEDKQYVHVCRITDVVTGKKLAYSWRYEDLPGDSHVTFELFPEGSKTRLKLTHIGVESFPSAKDPNFTKESFQQGWTHIIGTSLTEFLLKSK